MCCYLPEYDPKNLFLKAKKAVEQQEKAAEQERKQFDALSDREKVRNTCIIARIGQFYYNLLVKGFFKFCEITS